MNPMPLDCQSSTLTTRPQRLMLNHKLITYPSDLYSAAVSTAIYITGEIHSRPSYSAISHLGNTRNTVEALNLHLKPVNFRYSHIVYIYWKQWNCSLEQYHCLWLKEVSSIISSGIILKSNFIVFKKIRLFSDNSIEQWFSLDIYMSHS